MRRLGIAFLMVFAVLALPSPVLAAGKIPVHQCTDPNYTSSSDSGTHGYGSYVVTQDVWNPEKITQTMHACNFNSFYVKATVGNEGGAVQSYPSSYENINDTEISAYKAITSDYRFTPPTGAGLDFEYAYDIWLGGATSWANPQTHTEMMIWDYVDGQVPAGSVVATTTLDNATWKVWFAGGIGQSNGDIVTFERTTQSKSGATNLLTFFDYAAKHNYLVSKKSTHLWQIDFGSELCATPSGGATFDLTDFNVKQTLS
jgi:hypothetical protein